MEPRSLSPICIVGVPMDLGQARRGVDMGPSAIRYANLDGHLRQLGCRVHDCGNIEIPVRDELPEEGGLAYLPAVIQAGQAVFEVGSEALRSDQFPIYLGGDHSIALGTVAAITGSIPNAGVIWIDAHGDFNTPASSPSGNLHGMPLAALTGRGQAELIDIGRPHRKLAEQNALLLGIRSLDPGERESLRASEVHVLTMREIDERGIGMIAHEALQRLHHCPSIHVSLDMDALDPREAPGVGTPVAGGLTYREAHLLMEILASSGKVRSMDVVEINPILDTRNQTAQIAVGLVASLLGRSIF
ncbi:MAG: arginase [Acidobacteriota bacterium]